jgi:transposase-like protein
MRAREVRGEALVGPERRRRWSTEEKLRILAQSMAPGSSVMLVCRMHGISSGQPYTWRRQFRTGELTGFAPVMVAPPVGELPAASAEGRRVVAGFGVGQHPPPQGLLDLTELRIN